MGKGLLAAGIAGLVLLQGCGAMTGREQYWSEGYGVRQLAIDSTSASMRLQEAIKRGKDADGKDKGLVEAACFQVPVPEGMDATCRQERNAALAALLVASDDLCQDHLRTIYGNDAFYNILFGTGATLFGGAAAIAGSASAKAALAAIATFSSAERSLINETVYKNMLVTATSKKIRETRAAKSTALVPATFRKSIDEYPMAMAVRDSIDYHYSCSFMLGLEKALEEGTNSNVEARKARLEQEKRNLELYVSNRKAVLGVSANGKSDIAADKGIAGANARIEAIEAQLLTLVKSQGSAPNNGEKSGDPDPDGSGAQKGDPIMLARAYFSLHDKIEPARQKLLAKLGSATPADASWIAALRGKLDAKVRALNEALAVPGSDCKSVMDGLNGQILAQQTRVIAATGDDARLRAGDKLAPMLVAAQRFTARLGALEAAYTREMAAMGKAIDDAQGSIDAALNAKLNAGLDNIAVPSGLCTL